VVEACAGVVVACRCGYSRSVMRVHSTWLTFVRLSRDSRSIMESSWFLAYVAVNGSTWQLMSSFYVILWRDVDTFSIRLDTHCYDIFLLDARPIDRTFTPM
jgi:hypothetical protein